MEDIRTSNGDLYHDFKDKLDYLIVYTYFNRDLKIERHVLWGKQHYPDDQLFKDIQMSRERAEARVANGQWIKFTEEEKAGFYTLNPEINNQLSTLRERRDHCLFRNAINARKTANHKRVGGRYG